MVRLGTRRADRTQLGVTPLLLAATPALAQDDAAVGAAAGGIAALLIIVVIGAAVGWVASLIVKGSGSGLVMDVIFGIGGSFLAGYLLPLLGISLGGMIGGFIAAVIGAVILILIVRLIRKAAN